MARRDAMGTRDAEAAMAAVRATVDALLARVEALEQRLDQRLTELRVKQDEELMLVKALSCQLRHRVERVERRAVRAGG